jgi:outer membrane protein
MKTIRIIMKKYIISLSMLVLCFNAQAQEAPKTTAPTTAPKSDFNNLKIAFVDPYRALEMSDEWKDEQKRIQAELQEQVKNYQKLEESFRAKQQELQNMGSAASESARKTKETELMKLQKQIMIERQVLEESSNQVMQEPQMKILKKIEETVNAIAREEGLDLVLGMGVVYASAKVDLTQKVMDRLNADYAKAKAKRPGAGVKPEAPKAVHHGDQSIKKDAPTTKTN